MRLWILIFPLPAILGFLSIGFEETRFATGAGQNALGALGALFIIAVFVERAQQVYLSAWRGPGKALRKAKVAGLESSLERLGSDAENSERKTITDQLQEANDALAEYRSETQRIALIGGLLLGVVISFVGPRILSEVIVVYGDMGAWQAALYHGADILITGGLLGGGSEGIHKLIALITDFLDITRDKIKKNQASR